eukprot:CAMPEP_0177379220 /NCGR_PEP_ID=MMETSP0368-20130122/46805_1 /TAXON_ID=447022 ORGANISM="Scrippsiella hangoei-like, Strain SHHI-4" /NCGR_SAMPLE_ID=MMETSP0368 /ASSEMBLY_ACC=CAM_ASM_000363 /LENGTH=169 /DNA_ID=CAMNT_0018843329 /DNA_START=288 /DNA_END=795 /DNA_ORIENTATION=+
MNHIVESPKVTLNISNKPGRLSCCTDSILDLVRLSLVALRQAPEGGHPKEDRHPAEQHCRHREPVTERFAFECTGSASMRHPVAEAASTLAAKPLDAIAQQLAGWKADVGPRATMACVALGILKVLPLRRTCAANAMESSAEHTATLNGTAVGAKAPSLNELRSAELDT